MPIGKNKDECVVKIPGFVLVGVISGGSLVVKFVLALTYMSYIYNSL